jgi:hypothetical protein
MGVEGMKEAMRRTKLMDMNKATIELAMFSL